MNVRRPICAFAAPGISTATLRSAPLNAVDGMSRRVGAPSSLVVYGEARNSASGSCLSDDAFSAAFFLPFGISSSCFVFSDMRLMISGVRPITANRTLAVSTRRTEISSFDPVGCFAFVTMLFLTLLNYVVVLRLI
jgi:hypothetical protein